MFCMRRCVQKIALKFMSFNLNIYINIVAEHAMHIRLIVYVVHCLSLLWWPHTHAPELNLNANSHFRHKRYLLDDMQTYGIYYTSGNGIGKSITALTIISYRGRSGRSLQTQPPPLCEMHINLMLDQHYYIFYCGAVDIFVDMKSILNKLICNRPLCFMINLLLLLCL